MFPGGESHVAPLVLAQENYLVLTLLKNTEFDQTICPDYMIGKCLASK